MTEPNSPKVNLTRPYPEGFLMNIDYANTIPLREILDKMGLSPISAEDHILVYQSPFNQCADAILKVNTQNNTWYETTLQIRGNVLSLVNRQLAYENKNNTPSDCLRWIKNTVGYVVLQTPKGLAEYYEMDARYLVKDASYISSGFLIAYLEDVRRIPLHFAVPLLKEVTIFNQKCGKEFKALGIENEDGGFAIRNPYIKGNTSPQSISFIRGTDPKPVTIHLFKDVMDYLSAIAHNGGKKFRGDTIILNATTNIPKSSGYIRNYGYEKAVTWFDNTGEGRVITHHYRTFFKSEPGIRHLMMNGLYKEHKDVNAWWVSQFQQCKNQ